jgi:hypothetical protein
VAIAGQSGPLLQKRYAAPALRRLDCTGCGYLVSRDCSTLGKESFEHGLRVT